MTDILLHATLLPHDCLKKIYTMYKMCKKKTLLLKFLLEYVCIIIIIIQENYEIKYKYINNYEATIYPKLGRLIDILLLAKEQSC